MPNTSMFSDLMSSLREVTSSTVKKYDSSNIVKFLKTNIKSLENILKTIDKMLKVRNIDIGDMYEQTKSKGKSLLDKGKKLFSETKEKGFLAMAKEKTLGIKSKLTSLFKDSNETGTSPPEGKEEEEKKSTKDDDKTASKDDSKKGKSNDASWIEKAKQREEKRKSEVEGEKKAVLEKSKAKIKDGWLGKILSGIMTLGGFLLTGFKKSIGFLGGFLVKGLGKSIASIVPGLATTIAKYTSGLVGGGLKAAGSALWTGAKAVGRNALPFARGALGVAARGIGMIATGPVGWAIAIGTAIYAGYKLYKYLTRNDVKDDIYGKLTRYRLLMYGFNDTKKEHYSKIFDLEMMMKDYVKFNKYYVKFNKYQVEISKLSKDDIDKILDIFKVDREEKDKYRILNTWFVKRFIPAYRSFMQALYTVNNSIYLDDLDKLKPLDLYNLVTKINTPSSIYNIEEAPTFEDPKIYVTKNEVDSMLTNIVNDVKDKVKTEPDRAKKIEEENARKKEQATKTQTKKIDETTKPVATTKPNNTGKDKGSDGSVDTEGENKPTVKQEVNIKEKVSNKLNKTSGEIVPGGMSLEGIQTKLPKEKIYNLDPNVRELFTGMAKEYNTLTGKSIPVNEAFRSFEDQQVLYNKYPGKAAKPGNSTHEYGLAVDINSEVANELDSLGLLRKYGFTRPIGGEKWHLEPIGVSLNPTLAKKDENYRYKSILASPGKGGDGYGTLDNAILKKRNVEYQLSVYNKDGENVIDPEKALNKAKFKSPLSEDKSTKGKDKPKETENRAPVYTATPKPVEKNTQIPGKSPDTEGENKPSIKQDKPTLDTKKPTVETNSNLDIAKYANLGPEEAIKQAAKLVGIDENTLLTFAKIESSLKGNAQSKSSSASSLFQLTDSTWKELVKSKGPLYGIPSNADKNNNFYNALMAAEYAKENISKLPEYKSAGLDDSTAMYLAHHYGLSGATKIINQIKQDPNASMKDVISDKAYSANKQEIGNNSVSSYIQKTSAKLQSASNTNYKSAVMTGSSSQSTSGPAPEINKSPAINKPVITATQNTSPYKSITAPTAQSVVQTQPQQNSVINTKNMESLMTDQLSSLNQIVSILNAINDKFDIDKLKNLGNIPNQQKPLDKSIPKNSVNLSNKSIQT